MNEQTIIIPERSSAMFTLKNGDQIRVELDMDGRLGEGAYRLRISGQRCPLSVMPDSRDVIEVSTPKALIKEEEEVNAIVARQISQGRRGWAAGR